MTLVLQLFFLKENGIKLLLILLLARDISKTTRRMEMIVIHKGRLRVVPYFSSGIVERAKRERA